MATLIIGDIHGCYGELMDLIDAAEIGANDPVIAVGDLIDRGPEPAEVLEFFRSSPRARALMGNHERKNLRWSRGELTPNLSQRIFGRQLGDAAWREACEWFATLPHWIELDEALCVHAFWEPGKSVEAQDERVIVGTRSGQRRLEEQLMGVPWYTQYDGAKPLVVGHRRYHDAGEPLVIDGRVYAIDTGCCRGQKLTGLRLPDFQIVQVPARQHHYRAVKREYAFLRYLDTPIEKFDFEKARAVCRSLEQRGTPADFEALDYAGLVQLLEEGERALAVLEERLESAHQLAAAQVEQATVSGPTEEAAVYARAVATSPMKALLFRRRTATSSRAVLEDALKRPADAQKWIERVAP